MVESHSDRLGGLIDCFVQPVAPSDSAGSGWYEQLMEQNFQENEKLTESKNY